MKKKLSVLLSIALVLVFALFAIASGDTEDSGDTAATQSSEEVIMQAAEDSNTLGSYEVEIKSARLTETYDGKPAVVITYGFTNNSDEAAAFFVSIDATVYQNDIGLNEAIMLKDGDAYSSDNQTKEIKKGATLDVDVAYELNDGESDVVVEAKETFSFTDDVVTRTFSIK